MEGAGEGLNGGIFDKVGGDDLGEGEERVQSVDIRGFQGGGWGWRGWEWLRWATVGM